MSILFTVIILGMIIFLHELGHFMLAKYYKMPVHEFAIGMGPKLFSKKKGETVYSIRALPLGGFVNIGGMQYEKVPEYTEEDFNKENEKIEETDLEKEEKNLIRAEIERIKNDNENGFYTKPALARFNVLIAGVVMNFLTALIMIMVMLGIDKAVPPKYSPAIIKAVHQDSNAKEIIKGNDEIVEFNGVKIKNQGDLIKEVAKVNKTKKDLNQSEFNIKIVRNNKEIVENVKVTYYEEAKMYLLGVQFLEHKASFFEKIKISFGIFFDYFKMMIEGVKMLVTGKIAASEMTGPVGLPKIIGQAYQNAGFLALINIFILLSINIGVMNLLPIPALDGGRLLFVIPEFIGIKVNKKIEEKLHLVGMIFLMGLMIFIIFNDIFKYFK